MIKVKNLKMQHQDIMYTGKIDMGELVLGWRWTRRRHGRFHFTLDGLTIKEGTELYNDLKEFLIFHIEKDAPGIINSKQ